VTTLDAYRDAASAWAGQVGSVYGRLARTVVGDCPVPLTGARVLDLGAGTGVVSDLAVAAGARVVAVDLSEDMLRYERAGRPTAVLADALVLPFRRASFDAVIAACLVNHFEHPADAIRAASSVVRSGGAVVASAFSAAPDPMKQALDHVATSHGWEPPAWYSMIKRASSTHLGTTDTFTATGRAGGLDAISVRRHDVDMSGLSPSDAVAYRFSLPPFAPWLGALDEAERRKVVDEATNAATPIIATWRVKLLVLAGAVG
jgi:SAM-dependent methyltransferase